MTLPMVPQEEPEELAMWRRIIEYRDELTTAIVRAHQTGVHRAGEHVSLEDLEREERERNTARACAWAGQYAPDLAPDELERFAARVAEHMEERYPVNAERRASRAREAVTKLRELDELIVKKASKPTKIVEGIPSVRGAVDAVSAYLGARTPESLAWALFRLASINSKWSSVTGERIEYAAEKHRQGNPSHAGPRWEARAVVADAIGLQSAFASILR